MPITSDFFPRPRCARARESCRPYSARAQSTAQPGCSGPSQSAARLRSADSRAKDCRCREDRLRADPSKYVLGRINLTSTLRQQPPIQPYTILPPLYVDRHCGMDFTGVFCHVRCTHPRLGPFFGPCTMRAALADEHGDGDVGRG